ncbi:metal transporter [Streptomyces filipinensis]|uniref:Metal transporter n=1 Tax=Streptomyces filipinensis TaxID=66887 RepID=A0A918IH44_9ACTN|nr:potassium channel family protein [Streptomyces filipinensis]GGV09892.1 metal transporter [Streptomyces filipinensis]
MNDPAVARDKHTSAGGHEVPSGRPRRRAAALSVARAGCIAVTLIAAYYLLPLDRPVTVGTSVLLTCGLLIVALVFGWEVWLIMRSPHPRLKAVEAMAITVASYLVLFASAYYLLERAVPGSFNEPLTRTDALYFTLSTFTTVGFGDIVARSQAGKVVVMIQMVCSLLLAGVAVRVLGTAVRAGLRQQGRQPPE